MTNVSTTIRDREVHVKVSMASAEPDVGIMGPYIEDYEITDDETGEVLDWELTHGELEQLADDAAEQAADDEADAAASWADAHYDD